MFTKRRRLFAFAGGVAALLSATPSLAGGVTPILTVTGNTSSIYSSGSAEITTSFNALPSTCSGQVNVKTVANPSAVVCSSASHPEGMPAGQHLATCTALGSTLGVGVHELKASYAYVQGEACYNSSISSSFMLTVVNPTPVPTVGEWTLWGMMGLMMMGGAALLIRRTRRLS